MMGIAAIIAADTLRASDVAASPDGAVLVGTKTPYSRVLIVKVSNGARVWEFAGDGEFSFSTSTGRKTTGTKITIPAGHYDLSVICLVFNLDSRTMESAPGVKTISVEAGHVYEIVGALSANKKQCNVSLSSRS
jgi:hypothetical protein